MVQSLKTLSSLPVFREARHERRPGVTITRAKQEALKVRHNGSPVLLFRTFSATGFHLQTQARARASLGLGYLVSARWALNRKLTMYLRLRANPALNIPWKNLNPPLKILLLMVGRSRCRVVLSASVRPWARRPLLGS